MSKFWKGGVGIGAAMVALAAIAFAGALTTFDPSTGIGFVGKGDLQTPWVWNNQKLQAEAANVDFSYVATSDYDVTCEFDTGPTGHVIHHVITTPVNDSVATDVTKTTRKNPQGDVTGFNLTGLGTPSGSGDPVPEVGATCPGNSGLGLVTAVTLIGSTGGLYASDSAVPIGPTLIWDSVLGSVHP